MTVGKEAGIHFNSNEKKNSFYVCVKRKIKRFKIENFLICANFKFKNIFICIIIVTTQKTNVNSSNFIIE